MKLKINVKQLGKKRPVIGLKEIEIDDLPENPILEDLLKAVVRQQVAVFNEKEEKEAFLNFLTEKQVEDKLETGKVGFGNRYNENLADVDKAIATALLAFKDGLFCVFIDEEEIENLPDEITVTEECVVSFIRLTFLAGSIW